MEYYVADSYKYFTREGEPFKKDGRMYTKASCKCDRCGGTGVFACRVENGHPVPHPAYGGVCLKCEGTGVLHKTIRLYTEKQYMAMQQRKEIEAEKRAAAAEERRVQARKKAFDKWLERNGFNENGDTYLIFGNTYPIKDQLKAAGCKFSRELKWHGPAAVDVPEDCSVEIIHWTDVYVWEDGSAELLRTADEFLNRIFSKNSEGDYIGEIGERLRNVTVTFTKATTFEGAFGVSSVYHFDYDGAQLRWMTTCEKNLQEGKTYQLTGTVKAHKVFGNVKMTYLSRCIIK